MQRQAFTSKRSLSDTDIKARISDVYMHRYRHIKSTVYMCVGRYREIVWANRLLLQMLQD